MAINANPHAHTRLSAFVERRILELYLNIAEFDEGVFGVEAAAQWYFGVRAVDLTLGQASALAAVLPNPKQRSARSPSAISATISRHPIRAGKMPTAASS